MDMKNKSGFTLLEAVVALAILMILSMGVLVVALHSSNSAAYLLARQDAFENARGVMDSIIMNVQTAYKVDVYVDNGNNLQEMSIRSLNPQLQSHPYTFIFFPASGQLGFGQGRENELASNIRSIRITTEPTDPPYSRMYITVTTACQAPREPIVLTGSVDIRHKYVTVTKP